MQVLGRTGILVILFGGAAVLASVLIAASLVGSRDAAHAEPTAVAAETDRLLRGVPQYGIALGSPDAPVTLVEYADLQCPYCAQWARDAFPALVEEYVRPGKLRIVFRGLAFIGPDSELALRAALAAGQQDGLWSLVHGLYTNQGAENAGWVTEDLLRTLGSAAGLDPERMLAETHSEAVERELAAAQREAQAAGVPGTPAFQLGPTGGALEPLTVSSLDAGAFRPALDELLTG